MAHEKSCQNCGKSFTGNISRRFCTDACRKYFKRHGEISMAGVKRDSGADKPGQDRTTPRAGGSSIGNYVAKKGIDFIFQTLADSVEKPKTSALTGSNTPTNTPLQVLNAGQSLDDPLNLFLLQRVMLSTDFTSFLGPVTYPFKMLVWGLPGSGKSTFCMKLANEIAAKHSLLYVAGEEALSSATLLDKQRRTLTGENAKRCVFLNRLPNSSLEWNKILSPVGPLKTTPYKAVLYDSVTKLGITPFYLDAAAHDFNLPMLTQSLSHVFITHAQKDGQQYRGDGSWGHEVDIIIRVEKGIAITEKNRFGEAGRTFKAF